MAINLLRGTGKKGDTYGLLEFGVLFLGVDQVEGDVECPGEDKREEKGEPSQVNVPLCAITGPELGCSRDKSGSTH